MPGCAPGANVCEVFGGEAGVVSSTGVGARVVDDDALEAVSQNV